MTDMDLDEVLEELTGTDSSETEQDLTSGSEEEKEDEKMLKKKSMKVSSQGSNGNSEVLSQSVSEINKLAPVGVDMGIVVGCFFKIMDGVNPLWVNVTVIVLALFVAFGNLLLSAINSSWKWCIQNRFCPLKFVLRFCGCRDEGNTENNGGNENREEMIERRWNEKKLLRKFVMFWCYTILTIVKILFAFSLALQDYPKWENGVTEQPVLDG